MLKLNATVGLITDMNPASSRARLNEDVSPFTRNLDYEAQKRVLLVEWINSLVPNACLPVKSSNGELRASLLDGVLLCQLLTRLKPNFQNQGTDPCTSLERLKKFLAAIAEAGLPGFEISDVEKGSMKPVLDCLYALKEKYMPNFVGSKFACSPYSPASSESQSGVFQKKQGFYLDVPVARISEMVKSNSLDNAPTQSLVSVVNGILDESIERRNTEIPQRVACLLRKVVQEIERRLATQAEHLRMQNSLFKGREEKYQSRIKVLETLAMGTSEESEIVMNELLRLKTEKKKQEQKKTSEDTNAPLGKKEKDQYERRISALKQDLALSKKALEGRVPEQKKTRNEDSVIAQLKKEKDKIELELSALKEDLAMSKKALEGRLPGPEQMKMGNDDNSMIAQLKKEKDQIKLELSTLKQEMETYRRTYEQSRIEMEHPTNDEDKEVVEVKNEKHQVDPDISRLKQELEMAKNAYEQSTSTGEVSRLMKVKDQCDLEIAELKQELGTLRKEYGQRCLQTEDQRDHVNTQAANEKNETDHEIIVLKKELETLRKAYEQRCLQTEDQRDQVNTRAANEKNETDHEIIVLKKELETLRKVYEQRCLQTEDQRDSENTEFVQVKNETDEKDHEIITLRQELETLRNAYEQRCLETEHQRDSENTAVAPVKNETDQKDHEIIALKQELETLRKAYEQRCLEAEHQRDSENTQVAQVKNETDQKDVEITRLKQELESVKRSYEQQKDSEDKQISHVENETDKNDPEVSRLKQELESAKRAHEQLCLEMESLKDSEEKQVAHVKNETDQNEAEVSRLKQELESAKRAYGQLCLEMESLKDSEEKQVAHVKNEMDQNEAEVSRLKQELESAKRAYEQLCLEMESLKDNEEKQVAHVKNEMDQNEAEVSRLKQELESAKRAYEQLCLEMESLKDNEEKQVARVKNEMDQNEAEVSRLKQELESAKRSYEQHCQDMEKRKHIDDEELSRLMKAKDQSDIEISTLKQEVETCKKTYESRCQELEMVKGKLDEELKEQEKSLQDAMNKAEEIEEKAKLKSKAWMRKENVFHSFISNHGATLQELKSSSESTKLELVKAQKSYLQELGRTGETFIGLAATAEKYHQVLYENRRIYNELQDLKGNIRVYCRIRPFLKGQTKKDTVIDTIGDYGELTIINPSKGKETQKSFKFNKVFSPTSTQEEVFKDTQPLVRTILDGFNVCIFAYGQTGSGKTYTMTGPEGASKDDWGVNYRALDDLFQISEERKRQFLYVISVQMVEIYNEQILDLLTSDSSQKKLGVLTGSQPNGIAVPDASMHTVQSTSDVIQLMSLGHANRTVSSTAMNERSSRSHSVVTIHVQGTDLKTNATTHASLHLVDLAGSERIDRSEVTGDRLREAQHINKSLSALGDVIFALAAKSNHVPYRNSKLTQVLQSSLGGRAKTLMFVQLNPDVTSFSETLSTLKFAERVSGVELGAARSNKEGREAKELGDQLESLKDIIAKKDEEIERLKALPSKRSTNSLAYNGSQSPTSTDNEDSIDRNSDSGSAQLTDNDERLSEESDSDLPGATEADAAFETKEAPRASKTSKNPEASPDKTRMGKPVSSRTRVSPATPASRLSQVKTTVKAATALRKPGSGPSSSASPGRPSSIASASPRTPSRRLG